MAPLTNLLWNLFSFCLKLFNEMQVIYGGSLLFLSLVTFQMMLRTEQPCGFSNIVFQ